MLYTVGTTEGYKKYMKDCLEKKEKPEKRKGGTVWRHIEDVLDYLREISNGSEYKIYGVIAEWILDTKLPEWNGDPSEIKDIKYHELTRDAEIVELMKPVELLTRDLPGFNCKGDVIMNGKKDIELEITKSIHRQYHFLKVNGKWNTSTMPMQNWNDTTIPLVVAEEGYKEYSTQQGTGQSLERLGERGGFAGSELSILLFERIKRLECKHGIEVAESNTKIQSLKRQLEKLGTITTIGEDKDA